MTLVARLGGAFLVLVVIALGVLIGRVIEAIAVATVLFAVWTCVRRLFTAPHAAMLHDGDGQGA
jgi:hypothetical protein